MKKRIKVFIFIALALVILSVLFWPFQSFLIDNLYSRTSINLCFLSYGHPSYRSNSDVAYYFYDIFSNRYKCYSKRAHELGEYKSCFGTDDPGSCLGNLSGVRKEYLCDQTKNTDIIRICNNYVISNVENFHDLPGIEKYRKYGEKEIENGAIIGAVAIRINHDGTINIPQLSNLKRTCDKTMDSPITLHGYTSVPPIYVVGCHIVDTSKILLNYFEYSFQQGYE